MRFLRYSTLVLFICRVFGRQQQGYRRSMSTPSVIINGRDLLNGECEFKKFENQVAGHQFVKGKDSVGILKCKDGKILKAFSNPTEGTRETKFYESLLNTNDPALLQLKEFTCNFHGTRSVVVNGKEREFLILDDLTEGFSEPCVMDVKIGKRTWDPTATPEKIAREQTKYSGTKKTLGICIPGFHVYRIPSRRLDKYNKAYGGKLDEYTIYYAIRTFLNANKEFEIDKELLMLILMQLWKIQKWAKTQKSIRLYATSILIIYDAKVLREKNKQNKIERRQSYIPPEALEKMRFKKENRREEPLLWHKTLHRQKSRSFDFNDPGYLSKVKQDYASALNDLISDEVDLDEPWCVVKIIDLGHVFPADEDEIDQNYLGGVNSLVEIFESFLIDSR